MGEPRRYRLLGSDGREVLSAVPGRLGGHSRTRVYGRLDCPVALSLIRRGFDVRPTRVFFADEAIAIAAGYRPCGACMREQYRRWKASQPSS
jgi:methylphosphotriester-DNA--protein-cysteine methyltransferase